MQHDVGSTGSDEGIDHQFMGVVGGLTDGELTFQAPFDPATSAALGDNIDLGELAERLFQVTAARDCGYEVLITALTPESVEPVRRELVNTTVSSTRLLFALLESLMDELETRVHADPNRE